MTSVRRRRSDASQARRTYPGRPLATTCWSTPTSSPHLVATNASSLPLLEDPPEQQLVGERAVHVGGVKEVRAGVERRVQRPAASAPGPVASGSSPSSSACSRVRSHPPAGPPPRLSCAPPGRIPPSSLPKLTSGPRSPSHSLLTMSADVWIPFDPAGLPGLPDTLDYRVWDGGPDFPADPADCAFYVVPYMKPSETAVRPLAAMTGLRVVQTLTAGIDHVQPGIGLLPPGVRLCNARGVHEASTAELALALVLASLRGIPGFVRGQERQEWRVGVLSRARRQVGPDRGLRRRSAPPSRTGSRPSNARGWRASRAPRAQRSAVKCTR